MDEIKSCSKVEAILKRGGKQTPVIQDLSPEERGFLEDELSILEQIPNDRERRILITINGHQTDIQGAITKISLALYEYPEGFPSIGDKVEITDVSGVMSRDVGLDKLLGRKLTVVARYPGNISKGGEPTLTLGNPGGLALVVNADGKVIDRSYI